MFFPVWLNLLLILPLALVAEPRMSPPAPPSGMSSTVAPLLWNVRQITRVNFNSTLSAYEVVFVNFYADWCHFSKLLMPIFEEAAIRLADTLSPAASVAMARVDCVREDQLARLCGISKFPTLRLYFRGHPLRQEYRGQRSVDALVAYVQKQSRPAIKRFVDIKQLDAIDVKRRTVIGFFESRKEADSTVFELLAKRYKNDCDFYMRNGARLDNVAYTQHMPTVVYRPDTAHTHAVDELFEGQVTSQPELEAWLLEKCVPLVREVNFGNVEEIIEQNLPLLVLFHMPNDANSVKDFKSIVEMQLASCTDCGRFNFVTVNGQQFQHSVQHMGKTLAELPLIAIDSLKFMHPYLKFKDMYIPGHLKQFIRDFSSQTQNVANADGAAAAAAGESNRPPLSTFKDLGPSKHRYSLVKHDEL